jgi:adenine-specific DNA-methyltransferase
MKTSSKAAREKLHGIHYTPVALADAVARRLIRECDIPIGRSLTVADPACGDGSLLAAFARIAADRDIPIHLIGYDLDPEAISQAADHLGRVLDLDLSTRDFLAGKDIGGDFFAQEVYRPLVDAYIANPPYVRTQVLGSDQARDLARRFGLKGRVDLAYAFCMAMVDALPQGGVFAFIISNKFLTIKAGESLRDYLKSETEILEVWDLGDSRLFSAAVLPCVIFGRRKRGGFTPGAAFKSMYTIRATPVSKPDAVECTTDAQLLERFSCGESQSRIAWRGEIFEIRAGTLQAKRSDGTWVLQDPVMAGVQSQLSTSNARHFSDVIKIKVGIKTTADAVYIRDDWDQLPEDTRPEDDILWPIRMTKDVGRWVPPAESTLRSRTLYPYRRDCRRRTPVDLDQYPRAQAYLEGHRRALEGRTYVIEAGRNWWEPWVPHHPWVWQQPRAVFPEIAERPLFSVDDSGAIANGTLFWAYPIAEGEPELLEAACAIANSAFATEFYDLLLGTRLYAGRRRWNAQHVGQLPFPGTDAAVSLLADLYHQAVAATRGEADLTAVEREIDQLCRALFSGAIHDAK